MSRTGLTRWIARLLVAAVFGMNVQCAMAFIVRPGAYIASFELSGASGLYLVQAMGILFLMWNVTYVPVILQPTKYRVVFGVVIAQQIIGLAGESWLLADLSPSHTALASTAARFVFFDTLALTALVAAFLLSRTRSPS
jgi:hypothetical protein